ncbi:MAG: ABC transporter ATP-binding protein [Acidimicrobiales bacterium]
MDTSNGGIAVSIRGLTKRYPGAATPAVDDLSLDVAAGEIVALVGPSGCGKTTILKMINRLIEPSAGTICVLGRDQTTLPVHELRRSIGYVIQQIGLFPHRSVARNVGVVPELLGWERARIAERVSELISLVGLPDDVADRYPSELSGGQQQRVGVARALAADPPLLLMDEPYSAVDPLVREKLQDDLLELQAQVGKTIILVTHDIDEAIRLGDRVAILAEGGVLAQYDTPDELLRAPADDFVAAFLGRERGLRRLGLRRVDELGPAPAVEVGPGASADEAIAAAGAVGVEWVVITDGNGILALATVAELESRPPGTAVAKGDRPPPVVPPDALLREALDAVLRSEAGAAVVAGGGNGAGGVLTLDTLADALR